MKFFGARLDRITRRLFLSILIFISGAFMASAQDVSSDESSSSANFAVIFQSPSEAIFEADEGKGLLDWEVFSVDDIVDGEPREEAEALDERLFEFEVQEAKTEDFSDASVRYTGKDSATYISGLSEGDYYFRVLATSEKNQSKSFSDPVQLKVEFVSMSLVWKLVGLGIAVFFATLWVVIRGGDPIETRDT